MADQIEETDQEEPTWRNQIRRDQSGHTNQERSIRRGDAPESQPQKHHVCTRSATNKISEALGFDRRGFIRTLRPPVPIPGKVVPRKLENVGGLSIDDRPDEAVEQGGYLRMLPKVTLLVGSDSILLVKNTKDQTAHTHTYACHFERVLLVLR